MKHRRTEFIKSFSKAYIGGSKFAQYRYQKNISIPNETIKAIIILGYIVSYIPFERSQLNFILSIQNSLLHFFNFDGIIGT